MPDAMGKVMPASEVLRFHSALKDMGIEIWLDGGWGVDALLREETRPHADLDIVIEEKDVARARALLEGWGYTDVPRDDTCPWNFVLGDSQGHEVDFHVIILNEHGDGVYGPPENGDIYPAVSLTGSDKVDQTPVRCKSAEWQLKHHTGYKLRPCDFQDVAALGVRFGLSLPQEYSR